MTTTTASWLRALPVCVWAVLLAFNLQSPASGQSTAFTYQGMLNSGGTPATGLYDFRFMVYDSLDSTGALIAGPITNAASPISNGWFCATLDFGSNVFTGPCRCLQIEVRTNDPTASTAFTLITPRQPITSTPYAMTAGNLSGSIPASQISGTLSAMQLPPALTINNASGTTTTGSFSGTFTGSFYGDGSGLTNLGFVKSFSSTNGFFVFNQNPDGSLNAMFVVTNVIGASGSSPASANESAPVNGYDVSSVTIFSTNTPPPGLVHKLVYSSGGQTYPQFEILRGLWNFSASDLGGIGGIHPAFMTNSAIESIQLHFDFVLDGSYFVFAMQTKNTTPVLTINGVDFTNIPILPWDSNQGWYFYKVQFQSSGRRNISIKMLSDDFNNEGFGGVWIDPSFGWVDGIPGRKYKLWYVGSSHSETPGPGAASGSNYLNDVDYGADLMKLFVNLDCHAEGSGGTGVANPGGSGRSKYIGRLGDAYQTKPDFIGIEALANDSSYSSNAFATNFVILIQNITNNLPGTPIVVWTSPFLNGTVSSVNNYSALTNEIALLGLTNFIDTLADPLFPPGFNPALQQAGGGIHLSPAGSWVYAEALANKLAQFFPSLIPSGFSAPTLPLTVPTGFSAVASSNIVTLSWFPPLAGASSYLLYRGYALGAEAPYAVTTATNYADTLVTNGTTYYYTVAGLSGNVTNPASYEIAATPSTFVPGPTNVSPQLTMVRWMDPTYGTFADYAGNNPATNGQRVLLWKDRSPNGYDLFAYAPAGPSHFTGAAALNATPDEACIFTNALTTETTFSNQPLTFVFAFQGGSTANAATLLDGNAMSGGRGAYSLSIGSGSRMISYGNATAADPYSYTNYGWMVASFYTNSCIVWTNGVLAHSSTSANSITNPLNGIVLGAEAMALANSGTYFPMTMGGFVQYLGNPTTNGDNNDLLIWSNYFNAYRHF